MKDNWSVESDLPAENILTAEGDWFVKNSQTAEKSLLAESNLSAENILTVEGNWFVKNSQALERS